MKDLIRYPKDEDGNRVGCFVAIVKDSVTHADDVVYIGWSSYNKDHEPKPFNKVMARDIARGRAVKGVTQGKMPDSLKKHVTSFLFKVNKAFGAETIIIVDQADPWAF